MAKSRWKNFSDFFRRDLWEADTASLHGYKSLVIKALRLLDIAMRDFSEGQLNLRAMGLVYTTLLSIVPLLAISFSVLKAFGVHNEFVEPFLLNFLAPLGPRGEEITVKIIGFVENMKVGVLGSLGLAMLIYTAVSVIQKVEKSFNTIWKIRKTRSLARRFSDYTSVIIIGPVLIFSAIGLTASFMSNAFVQRIVSIEPFGTVFYFFAEKAPYIMVSAAFTFIYIFVPNTRVKFRSALVGGLLAGILWETAGWAFASFIVSSTKYAAIYSGFAILIMFMIWLYVSWLILLVGAQIAFYHQYPHFLTARKEIFRQSGRLRERLSFLIMYFIGYNYYHSKRPWNLERLVHRLELPVDTALELISLLEGNGLIIETSDDPPAYIPSRDIGRIPLKAILDSVRTAGEETFRIEERLVPVQGVDNVIRALDNACEETLAEQTLKDIVISRH